MQYREKCPAAGMDDHLGKPFTAGDLRVVLEHWLGEQESAPRHAPAQPRERATDDPGDAIRRPPSNGRSEEDQKLTVLYVEDNPANSDLVKAILSTRSNTMFLSAHHAELGIELAQTHCPDLILMDLGLPGMDGMTAMKKLQTIEETQNIPVVAVSGKAMRADIKRAEAAGFADYLVKPFDITGFHATIDRFLKHESHSTEKSNIS